MSAEADPILLIAATSGRALAQSARRGGLRAAVLDCFADEDTRAAAAACRRVSGGQPLEFDAEALLRAADELAPAVRCAGVVYGSGFEDRPELLARLGAARRVFGNAPGTVAAAKEPSGFFALLAELGIDHPQWSAIPPARPEGWLAKRVGGSGGGHVRPACAGERADARTYYQRFEAGRTLSALFLADGSRAQIVGFSEQFVADGASGFRFGGLIGGLRLSDAVERRIGAIADALARRLGLRGLNGIDFLQQEERLLMLELNPRPTAAIDLYDADHPGGLLARHLAACSGTPVPTIAPGRAPRGSAVVYAPAALSIEAHVRFPPWCSDLPATGTRIATGDPVCSVHASADSAGAVARLLRRRRAALDDTLFRRAA